MATFRRLASGRVRAEIRRKNPAFYWSDSFHNMTEARSHAAKIEADWYAGKRGGLPDKTFGELMQRYADEESTKKKSVKWETARVQALQKDPLSKIKVSDLSSVGVSEWRNRRLQTVEGATVNREWNLYSKACNTAVNEWKWLEKNPFSTVKRPPSARHRERLITQDEIEALGVAAGSELTAVSGRVYQAFLFALETGMREGEIAAMLPADVNLDVAVTSIKGLKLGAGKTEAARRQIPMTERAIEIVTAMLPLRHDETVFGVSASQIESNFRRIRVLAGGEGYTFHDSRHNAATIWAKRLKGDARAVFALCKIFGWRDVKMALTYFNESAADIARDL